MILKSKMEAFAVDFKIRHGTVSTVEAPHDNCLVNPGETSWWEITEPVERKRVYLRQFNRVWRNNHPGHDKVVSLRYSKGHAEEISEAKRRRYAANPRKYLDAMKRLYERNPGYATGAMIKFFSTPKGRLCRARILSRRRSRSTNPEVFAYRVLMLHTLKEPCAICGIPYSVSHQVDHIRALCLGGTDDWDNLQPACVPCHRIKSADDLHKYRQLIQIALNSPS